MRLPARHIIFVSVLSAIAIGVYILSSVILFRSGFPLDDAWIHHTYARNLALQGEWAFAPGMPSAGSTSPLWTAMLAVGHYFRLDPILWAFFLGWLNLVGISIIGMLAFQTLYPDRKTWIILAGTLLILEWHLVWAASSGMETLLFANLAFLTMTWLASGWGRWIGLGTLIGLSVWVRPDGITLIGPAIFTILLIGLSWKERLTNGAKLILGFVIIFSMYLLFNWLIGGAIWPNTFYAKQAEYAIEIQEPLISRFGEQAILPMVGVGVLLLPGFLFVCYFKVRSRSWGVIAGVIWAVSYLALYAWRLPVTYQHGRYVIPMMPIYFFWGFTGVFLLLQLDSSTFWRRVVSRGWLISIGLVLIIFTGIGARAYARDVAVIESEMVVAAEWIAENTDQQALIAAHDIGALGFFGERKVLDLAGLVSPEVIPFIRDEYELARYLDKRDADYLVTFPDWYPILVASSIPVFDTQGQYAPSQGGENMVVYLWNQEP